MKPLQTFLQILLFLGCTTLHAQDNQWTWVSGDHITETFSNYGTKGIAAATNHPGPRSQSTSCTDRFGNFWLFGGNGKDATGKEGILNDLWKWDGTYWIWISGSNLANQAGNFGSQGIASPSNIPPSRTAGICGFDNNGNLWLFGGSYDGSTGWSGLNDLWKWDGNNWTWVKGTNNVNSLTTSNWGHYGTYNIPSLTNTPGGRNNAVGWTDNTGNLWLFGGNGLADSSENFNGGLLNDLWKWDGSNWTWIHGNMWAASKGVYGKKGIADYFNNPGSKSEATVMKDKNGAIWLFGGNTFFSVNDLNGLFANDLWKWDGTNWTWISGSDTSFQNPVYGQMGVPAINNVPIAGSGYTGWVDSSNNLFLYGGLSTTRGTYYYGFPLMGVLWKWDGTNWTWVRGDTLLHTAGNYGEMNIASKSNTPSSRKNALNWLDKSGHLYLMGGFGVYNTAVADCNLNDTWYWDGSNWIWTSGAQSKTSGSFGTKGITAVSNQPDARSSGISWQDKNGDLWLFGGSKSYYNYSNDMWKWDGSNWTWMNGSDSINQPGNFGILGITASTNIPTARSAAQSWYDKNGILWLFGGVGYDTLYYSIPGYRLFGSPFVMNDLWKWDGGNWTWVKGRTAASYHLYPVANYGQKGITDSANNPSSYLGATWTDKMDNLWLYGGLGKDGSQNDVLWKYDGTNWTWMKGDTCNAYQWIPGVYGSIGKADSTNSPGSRIGATVWKDSSDNLYLFGGYMMEYKQTSSAVTSNTLYFNDFWKWDGNNWSWLNGSSFGNPNSGNYGNKGIAAATNLPSERVSAASWTDNRGNFWLYGGGGPKGTFNDLWVWDGKNWTWIGGDSSINPQGVYGTKGLSDPKNNPGARGGAIYWKDNKNNSFWLFGGFGLYKGTNISFNDLWKFSPGIVTAISPLTSLPSISSKILLLNNPSPLDRFQFRSDQFYQKLNWQIIDESGRILQEGKLYTILKGSFQMVTTQHLNSGNYFIRFLGEDKKMQTLKWIKQ